MILKKVGVLSAGKISAIMYVIFGLIVGAFFSVFSLFAAAFTDSGSEFGFIFGIGAIILFPIIYGIIGFFAGIITAFIYNAIAKAIGGLEVEFEDDKPVMEQQYPQ
ncbi:MAG: DUF3566 domain-containing protein [Candidatus Zixiibacteriota bacterium]